MLQSRFASWLLSTNIFCLVPVTSTKSFVIARQRSYERHHYESDEEVLIRSFTEYFVLLGFIEARPFAILKPSMFIDGQMIQRFCHGSAILRQIPTCCKSSFPLSHVHEF
jgi:hypothetical protein